MTAGRSFDATRARVSEEAPSPERSRGPTCHRFVVDGLPGILRTLCGHRRGGSAFNPEALDDLVQEVFIVIHAKLHGLEAPERLRSWIYGVVRRMASDHRRAQRTQIAAGVLVGSVGETASQQPTPLEQLNTNADIELLVSLLAELDEPKREIFALVEVATAS